MSAATHHTFLLEPNNNSRHSHPESENQKTRLHCQFFCSLPNIISNLCLIEDFFDTSSLHKITTFSSQSVSLHQKQVTLSENLHNMFCQHVPLCRDSYCTYTSATFIHVNQLIDDVSLMPLLYDLTVHVFQEILYDCFQSSQENNFPSNVHESLWARLQQNKPKMNTCQPQYRDKASAARPKLNYSGVCQLQYFV